MSGQYPNMRSAVAPVLSPGAPGPFRTGVRGVRPLPGLIAPTPANSNALGAMARALKIGRAITTAARSPRLALLGVVGYGLYHWYQHSPSVDPHWDYGGWNVTIGPCAAGDPPTGFTPNASGIGTCYTSQLFVDSTITSTPPIAATTDHVKRTGNYPWAPGLGYYNRHTKLVWSGSGSRDVTWVEEQPAVLAPAPALAPAAMPVGGPVGMLTDYPAGS